MGVVRQMADGFRNVVARIGGKDDKSAFGEYLFVPKTAPELLSAYRTSGLAQRIVDVPAEDACREWREWQATAEQISAIEAEEHRLKVQPLVLASQKRARLYGGAALYIGTGDSNSAEPLEPERVRKQGIQHLTPLGMHDLSPLEYENDPREPVFGQPRMWQLRGETPVHPTRLVIFKGVEVPEDFHMVAWGDSALQSSLDSLANIDTGVAAIVSLIIDAKTDVIGIPNFSKNLEQGGDIYEEAVVRRIKLMQKAKGINSTLLRDALETYDQKSASFAGLPDIMDRLMYILSSVTGIPVALLFGRAPAGLNATGESDIRAHYDRIKVHQTMRMSPAMENLDECLIRSALGSRPKDIHYNWRPLWQPSASERAEIGTKIADTFKKLDEMQSFSPEALSKAAVNALTEAGAAPGLEAAVEEHPYEEPETLSPAEAGQLPPANIPGQPDPNRPPEQAVGDAAARTLYIRRDVLNSADIIRWARAQGIEPIMAGDQMHVTVMFSRTPVDWIKAGQDFQEQVIIPAGGPRIMERFGEALVLQFASPDLQWRHEMIKEAAGASFDFPEYQPHVTISWGSLLDPETIKPYQGPIVLGPEVFEEVNEDWRNEVAE